MKQQTRQLLFPLAAALRLITLTAFLLALPGLAKAEALPALDVSAAGFPTDKEITLTYNSVAGWSYSWDSGTPVKFNGTLTGTLTTAGGFNIDVPIYPDKDQLPILTIKDATLACTESGTNLFSYNSSYQLTLIINNTNLTASGNVFGGENTNANKIFILTEGESPCVINGAVNLPAYNLEINGGTGKGLTIDGRVIGGNYNKSVTMSGDIKVYGDVCIQKNGSTLTVGDSVKVASNDFAFTKGDGMTTITYSTPILQWTYATALAEGKLTIKRGETVVATIPTNGTRKSFGIGGKTKETYTVWYAPTGKEPVIQTDKDGKSQFTPRSNSEFLSSTDMGDVPALDVSKLPEGMDFILNCTSGAWSCTWTEGGLANEIAFNGTLTGVNSSVGGFNIIDMSASATLKITNAKITGVNNDDGLLHTIFDCRHPKGTTLTFEISNSTLTARSTFSASWGDKGAVIINTVGTAPCVINGDIALNRDNLTVDGGTEGGLTVNGKISAAAAGSKNLDIQIKGKITMNDHVITSAPCRLTVGPDVRVATVRTEVTAFFIPNSKTTTYNSPIFQWTYDTAPAAGTLTIKKDGTNPATFATDGKLRSFGIGGETNKTYTVWYTPKGKTELIKQSDANGKSEFTLTGNGLLSSVKMQARANAPVVPDKGTDITITGDGKYEEETGTATDFNKSIGNGKDTLTIGKLTFDTPTTSTSTPVTVTAKKLTIGGLMTVKEKAQVNLIFEGENKCGDVSVVAGGELTFNKKDSTTITCGTITNLGKFTDETGQILKVYMKDNQPLTLQKNASSAPVGNVQPGGKIILKVSATLGAGTATIIEYQWQQRNATSKAWENVVEPAKTKSSEAAPTPTTATYGQSATLEVNATGEYRCQVKCGTHPTMTVLSHYTTVTDPLFIANEADLKAFRDSVNGGKDYTGLIACLTSDITLTGKWTPIGIVAGKATAFTGTFDGGGHTISGLTVDETGTANEAGLFSRIGTGGTVQNLGVKGTVTGDGYAGGIAGHNNSGTIRNCYTHVAVTSPNSNVGGITGSNSGTLHDCYTTGTATGEKGNAGGIAGNSNGTIRNCYATGTIKGNQAGGIAGTNTGTAQNCIALNDFITGTTSAGRITGDNTGTLSANYAFSFISGAWTDKAPGKKDGADLTEANFIGADPTTTGSVFTGWGTSWSFANPSLLPQLLIDNGSPISGQSDRARADFMTVQISTAVTYDATLHNNKSIYIVGPDGHFTVNANGEASLRTVTVGRGGRLTMGTVVDAGKHSIDNLIIEDSAQVFVKKAFKLNKLLSSPRTMDKWWMAVGNPFDITVTTVDNSKTTFYTMNGYSAAAADKQKWEPIVHHTDVSALHIEAPCLLVLKDEVDVTFSSSQVTTTAPLIVQADPDPTTGEALYTGSFLFCANPTLHDVIIPMAYLLSADGTYFERTEKAVVKPFQSYLVANAVTSATVMSLRAGGIPTANEPIVLPNDDTFRVWGANGQLHLSADTPHDVAVYSLNGRLLRRFTLTGEETLSLPRGIYIVNSTDKTNRSSNITYKVSL